MDYPAIKKLLVKLKIPHHDVLLFEQAFTHKSYKNESKDDYFLDYERLETLGDAVLSLIVLDISYRFRPSYGPGDLTALKIDFVQANSLIRYGQQLGFEAYIRTGKGVNVEHNPKIIEDVFEACLGAIYLDSGFGAAYKFIENLMGDEIVKFEPTKGKNRDYKSELQIAFQSEKKTSLVYTTIKKEGKDNDPFFTVGVYYEGSLLGIGQGKSKKLAEQEAAREALGKMVK